MNIDTSLTQNPPAEAASAGPLWSKLTRWWAPAPAAADPVLGWESALPWTLGEDAPAERTENRY